MRRRTPRPEHEPHQPPTRKPSAAYDTSSILVRVIPSAPPRSAAACASSAARARSTYCAVLRFEGDPHPVLGIVQLRIRSEQQLGKLLQGAVEIGRDRALALARVDDAQVERIGANAASSPPTCRGTSPESRAGCRCSRPGRSGTEVAVEVSSVPSTTSAILRRASLMRSPKYSRSVCSMSGWRTTGRPRPRATPAMVTSSCVGPTPPEVKRTSNAAASPAPRRRCRRSRRG